MPEKLGIQIGEDQRVTAIVYSASGREKLGVTLLLGHGAGANQTSDFMVSFAEALAAQGLDTVTFNFLYTEEGRRAPDPNARLEACYGALIDAVSAHRELHLNKLVIGGKSMGGRIASQVAANRIAGPDGLVFLGYPLHPPGKPDQLRAAHLSRIRSPMLFVQGSRDAFGTPDEMRPIIKKLGGLASLYIVEGGDHSFKVPKRQGVPQDRVFACVQDEIRSWVLRVIAR
ncbi:MAG TPA: alpha/beta fold hydrolase [Blastocatellia bacterium]|nr:alpha/beta fold hydrolase [Blastocatellia bacterium]